MNEYQYFKPTPRQTSRLPKPSNHDRERYRHQVAQTRCTECDSRISDDNPFYGLGCAECTNPWE